MPSLETLLVACTCVLPSVELGGIRNCRGGRRYNVFFPKSPRVPREARAGAPFILGRDGRVAAGRTHALLAARLSGRQDLSVAAAHALSLLASCPASTTKPDPMHVPHACPSARRTQFGNIVLGGKDAHRDESTGTLKLHADGLGFKSRKTGNIISVQKADLRSAEWIKIPHAYQLKVKARGGFAYRFNGFRGQDKETVKGFVSETFGLELETRELSYKGWNWGQAIIEGGNVSFNVEDKQTLEVPLTDISQASAQKNEAVRPTFPTAYLGAARHAPPPPRPPPLLSLSSPAHASHPPVAASYPAPPHSVREPCATPCGEQVIEFAGDDTALPEDEVRFLPTERRALPTERLRCGGSDRAAPPH